MRKHVLPTLLFVFSGFGISQLSAQDISLEYVASHFTDVFDDGAAEIAAFDASTARIFFTNANANTIGILDISDPQNPTLVKEIDCSSYGGGINSVATFNGLVAAAIEADPKQDPGAVVFFDTDGQFISQVTVGALPDMLIFTPDGTKVLTANEGEPNDDYTVDPEGSVSIIDISGGPVGASVTTISFSAYNDKKAHLLNKGIRIYGPNATVAQDLEPEYIAVSPDNRQAFVSLQENNALAVIDLATATLVDLVPLGYKDHQRGEAQLTENALNELPGWPELGTPVYGGGQPPVSLGGFSGLYFDATESDETNYVFYLIPDRGPSDAPVAESDLVYPAADERFGDLRPFKLPRYQATISKVSLNRETGQVALSGQIPLFRTVNGDEQRIITGLSQVIGLDEWPVTYADPNTPYNDTSFIDKNGVAYHDLLQLGTSDPFGGDMEGITRDRDGNFWLCDEYRPSIYKFSPGGEMMARYVPVGTAVSNIIPLPAGEFGPETLPSVYKKRRNNLGFEAIAYDYDAHIIYAFMQSPLDNPGNLTRTSDIIRILAINPDSGNPVGEYVYLLEKNRDAGDIPGGQRVDKIGDAVYIGKNRFMVIERDSGLPGGQQNSQKLVFEINLTGATNLLADLTFRRLSEKEELDGEDDFTLDMMTADELVAYGITPVHKTKVLNLPTLGYFPSDKAEGIAVLPDGSIAVINDNDFGIAGAGVTDLSSLGIISFKNNNQFDASDRDGGVNLAIHPTLGMYQPDAITSLEADGKTYILTANEGDARDYDGYSEEERIKDLVLNPVSFPDASNLQDDANIGRLRTTSASGDLDSNGDYEILYTYGGRSFSVWDTNGNLLFDSGDALESITASALPENFNSNNDDNDSFDSRSDDKGPEPEAITVGEVMGVPYAFIGLERIGGVVIYNITDPAQPVFVDYLNNRDFGLPATSREAGDLGPEDIVFISAEDSPAGVPLVVTANEVSGTVSIFSIGMLPTDTEDVADHTSPWRLYPNPAGEVLYTNTVSDYEVFSTLGQPLLRTLNTNRIELTRLPAGTYILRDVARNRSKLFVKSE